MRLIDKKSPHRQVRELSQDEADSVRRYCSKGGRPEEHDAAVVEALLQEMRDGREPKYWLECDCRCVEVNGSHEPRLTVRPSKSSSLHLVRLKYGPHRCSLEFLREPTDEDEDDNEDSAETSGKHDPLRPVRNPIDFLDDLAATGGGGGRVRVERPVRGAD